MDGYLDNTGFDPYDYYVPGEAAQIVPRKEPMSPEEQEEFDTFWSQMEALEIEEQGERAKNLCASSCRVINSRIIPLFCGNFRACERCRKYRVKDWCGRLKRAMRQYAQDHPGAVWQYKAFSHEYATAVRKAGIPYYSFPVEGGVTVIVSPEIADGETVPTLDFALKRLMEKWAMTPRKMRPSRSRRFVEKKAERLDEPQPSLIVGASAAKVGEVAKAAGAKVEVLADGLTHEFLNLDLLELAYDLLLQGISVKLVANSAITPLDPYGTILQPIWEKRQQKAENDPPEVGDGLR